MIHYHGTPLSGTNDEKGRFFVGRHALVPFTYQGDMEVVAEFSQSFVLDNGAFTIWKQGGELDYEGYIKWVSHWHRHPGFDWALIPDVIDGNEMQNDSYLSEWPTELKGVPVYHLHESISRLGRLIDEYEVIALGSSGKFSQPGNFGWWGRMTTIMNAICTDKGNPLAKLHGLRMLDHRIFKHIPLSSADSTNAAVNSGSPRLFGQYPPAKTVQRTQVIADRIESYNSAPVWSGYNQEEFNLVGHVSVN